MSVVLEASLWENRKFAEEIARIYGADHPRYKRLEKEINKGIQTRQNSKDKKDGK